MSHDYDLALQGAVVTALKSDAPLSALIGARVYSERPPNDAPRPYVYFGSIETRPLRSDCGSGATVTFGIEAVSRAVENADVEAKQVANLVADALDGVSIGITGFDLVQLHWQGASGGLSGDGRSYERVAAFTAILDG